MNSKNPLVRKRPKKEDLIYKGRVWYAGIDGKDNGTGHSPILISPQLIWFSKDFSIPTYWVTKVEPYGSGFLLEWHNELNREMESAIFCIRSFLGYNLKKRGEIIDAIKKAGAATKQTINSEKTKIDVLKANGCQKCGNHQARQLEFILMVGIVLMYTTRSTNYYLCKEHALKTFRMTFLRNVFFNLFGIAGYFGISNLANINIMVHNDFMSASQSKKFKILTFVPLVLLVIFIASLIFLD